MHHVVLFADPVILPGLHVTLMSLLESLRQEEHRELKIVLFADRIPECEKVRIRQTHRSAAKGTTLDIRDYSPQAPSGAGTLHGNSTAYGRLDIAQLLPDIDRCVYLDSDLLVQTSVMSVFGHFDGTTAALVGETYSWVGTVDARFFNRAGLLPEDRIFNSGVLGIDLAQWRRLDVAARCRMVAADLGGPFATADQVLLNVVLRDSYLALGKRFNTLLFPAAAPSPDAGDAIYHFVGLPKPWDECGRHLHGNHALWHRVYRRTAISHVDPWTYTPRVRRVLMRRRFQDKVGGHR